MGVAAVQKHRPGAHQVRAPQLRPIRAAGNKILVELGLQRSQQVRRLVLTGIPMFAPAERAERLRQAETQPGPDEQGDTARALFDMFWTYAVTKRDRRVPLDKAVWNFVDKSRAMHRYTGVYRAVWAWDYTRLALVNQPVLLLQPAEDLRDASISAAALLPDSKVREMPDLTSDIFDLAAERLATEMRCFLD